MKVSRIISKRIFLAVLALSLLLVACVPQRQGVSWADLSVFGDDNYIMMAFNDYIVLIDPANGRPVQLRNAQGQVRTDDAGNPRRWIIDGGETGSQFYSTPIPLDDNRLLVADYNDRLLTINLERAAIEPGSDVALPGHVLADLVVDNGTIYIPFSENDVAAYNLATFEELWRFETRRGVWSAPVLLDGTLYFGSMDHNIYAVDAATGREIWSTDTGGAMAASPLLVDDRLYIGTFAREILEVSLDGEVLNIVKTNDWVWSTPVLRDDVLYVTDMGGRVHALDPNNNLAQVWSVQPASKGIRAQPLVTEAYVIVADRDGKVYWLDRGSGQVFADFTQDVGAEILSDILLVEQGGDLETLVVVSTVKNDKALAAFTLDAVPRWTYSH